MYTFEHFIEHDYHILDKETKKIIFIKNNDTWAEIIRRKGQDKINGTLVIVHSSDEDAYESYSESMESYGFKRFNVICGKF